MKDFKKGKTVKLANGKDVTVISKIGEGGQGKVYKVEYEGKAYALKWYLSSYLKGIIARNPSNIENFYNSLDKNAAVGRPSKDFLWPLAVTEKQDGSFGYLMDLRPAQYQSFAKILNATVNFKSTFAVINSTISMVNAFQALHRKGYSYQDLNDGNFFVDPDNGYILICDNDNVAPYGEGFGIAGKSRYMAPEIVLGKAKPNITTDSYSLAVILFMFYFLSHPLEGVKVVECPCLTEALEKQFYANEPIFICDPNDASNRPVRGIHNNIIKLWPLFPGYLQSAFVRAFCQGAIIPEDRLSEAEWQKILYKLRDDFFPCPRCNEGNFASMAHGDIVKCCDCGGNIMKPLSLSGKHFEVALYPDKIITESHTEGGDYSRAAGKVVRNKKNPNLWGIKNESGKTWIARMPNGEQKMIMQNDVVQIFKGVTMQFGNWEATIK